MLLRQLRYFCTVVSCNSFTKAAEASYISQSAISQQIKAMETELGVELLHRQGRGFSLTPAGELFYRKGQDILSQMDQLCFEARGLGEETDGPTALRVGYLNRYEGWEVQGAVAAFALRHPHITVSAVSGSHDEIYEQYMAGKLDVLFNDQRRQFSDRFVNKLLLTCYAYVEVSEGSKLAWYGSLSMAQLAEEPCVVIAEDDLRDVERGYQRNVLGLKGDILFSSNLEEARMLVAGNRGFLMVEARNQEAAAHSVIRRIPLINDEGQIRHAYYAFWLKERANPLIEEFVDILEGLFADGVAV